MCNYLRHLLHPGNSKIATLNDDLGDISFPPNQQCWVSIATSSTTNSATQSCALLAAKAGTGPLVEEYVASINLSTFSLSFSSKLRFSLHQNGSRANVAVKGLSREISERHANFKKDLGVSKNSGTPKWMVYDGKPLLKWMIWWYDYFRKHPSVKISALCILCILESLFFFWEAGAGF